MLMCLVHKATWNENGCPVCVGEFNELIAALKQMIQVFDGALSKPESNLTITRAKNIIFKIEKEKLI